MVVYEQLFISIGLQAALARMQRCGHIGHMRKIGMSAVVIVLGVAACGDWPDVPDTATGGPIGPWPSLQPIGGSQELVQVSDPSFDVIENRAARLRARASVLRTPVPDQASFDRLRAQIAR